MILGLAIIFVLPLMFHEEYLQSILVTDPSFPNFNAGMLEVLKWTLVFPYGNLCLNPSIFRNEQLSLVGFGIVASVIILAMPLE